MFRIYNSDATSTVKHTISYDYYPITCGDIRMEVDVSGQSFVCANYIGRANQPNIFYSNDTGETTKYQTARIFAYGKLHSIQDIDHDGEIVIEHAPISSSNSRLFSCFLIRSDELDYPANRTSLSDFMSAPGVFGFNPTQVSVSLNEYLSMAPSGDGVMQYDTRGSDGILCHVLVFTKLIRTRGDFRALSTRAPFSARPLTQPLSAIARSIEGFSTTTIEGEQVLTSDGPANDIFTCEYLPVSTDTAKVFQIPIDTKMVNESSNNQFSSMTTYIILSVMLTVATYFCAPAIYHAEWLADYNIRLDAPFLFIRAFKDDMTYLDLFLVTITTILSITLISIGIKTANTALSLLGIFFVIMFVVGIGSIQINTLLRRAAAIT